MRIVSLKYILIFWLLLISMQYYARGQKSFSHICDGYIRVQGNTNVDKFELKSQEYNVILESGENNKPTDSSFLLNIAIPVKEFEAKNPFIYHDFLQLINATEYPFIEVKIEYPTYFNSLDYTHYDKFPVEITIAGKTNKYYITCELQHCSINKNYIFISGSYEVKLTDFNLEPPERFQGLIKVGNILKVKFGFSIYSNEIKKLTAFESKY